MCMKNEGHCLPRPILSYKLFTLTALHLPTLFFIYGGHAATLLIYFIFWGARAEDRTRGCLTAAQRATCMLCRHPYMPCRHPCMLRRHSFFTPPSLWWCVKKNKKIDQEGCDPKEREQKRVVRFWSTKLFTGPIWLTKGTLTDEYIYM